MRLTCVLFVILIIETLTARADILSVSGYLSAPDGVKIGEVQVKLVHGKFKKSEAAFDSITPPDSFRIDLENASYKLPWFIICEAEYNKQKYFAATSSKLAFVRKLDTREGVMWAAKVNLKLYSKQSANYLSPVEASEAIAANNTIIALMVQSGEIGAEEADELAYKETAEILGRTQLGNNPEETLLQINQDIVNEFDKSLPALAVLDKENFLKVRDHSKFMNPSPEFLKPNEFFQPSFLSPPRPSEIRLHLGVKTDFQASSVIKKLPEDLDFIIQNWNRSVFTMPAYIEFGAPSNFGIYSAHGHQTSAPLIVTAWDSAGIGTTSSFRFNEFYTSSGLNSNYLGLFTKNDVLSPNVNHYFGSPIFNSSTLGNTHPSNLRNFSRCKIRQCAVTEDGRVVILKSDGTWEDYTLLGVPLRLGLRFRF
ncbi:MAG TPA: hypothetical protein VK400_12315 [Pyrinomonadaceae bacterium]|nr:hypothetical protein [Pyrinomonadaceae bacterium]